MKSGGQAVLFVGDLSYADRYPNNDGTRWDSWGRFVERSVAFQAWIWSAGNHEIEYSPDLVSFICISVPEMCLIYVTYLTQMVFSEQLMILQCYRQPGVWIVISFLEHVRLLT